MRNVWHNSMVGGLALLIVPCKQVTVDIKLTNGERCFYWRIYAEVVREIPEVESPEEKWPRRAAGMGIYHCRTCGFSRHLS